MIFDWLAKTVRKSVMPEKDKHEVFVHVSVIGLNHKTSVIKMRLTIWSAVCWRGVKK